MKHILLVLTLIFSLPVFAAFKNAAEAESKLKTFSSEQFKDKDEKAQDKIEDDIVDSIIDGVEVVLKESTQTNLKKEIVRVAVILQKRDPSNYAGELVLPLYKANRTEFKTLLKSLPPKDARLLEEAVKIAERVENQGNG
jgi:hypothetical protein